MAQFSRPKTSRTTNPSRLLSHLALFLVGFASAFLMLEIFRSYRFASGVILSSNNKASSSSQISHLEQPLQKSNDELDLGAEKKKVVDDNKNTAPANDDDSSNSPLARQFVVGIMVTDKDHYLEALKAQADTWLNAVPPSRAFVVGPSSLQNSNKIGPHPRLVTSPCDDRELWCKRLEHVVEAGRLLKRGIQFDWLFSGNEDWYVDVEAMLDVLKHQKRGPKDAVVYTGLGCSQWWQYHKDSKNNTLPKPPGFPQHQTCETLKQRGGICGGGGIIFSRKAVEVMTRDGGDALYERTRSEPFPWDDHPQGDPVLSCVIYSFHDEIELAVTPWKAGTPGDVKKLVPIRDQTECPRCRIATIHAVRDKETSSASIIYEAHEIVTAEGKK